MKDYAEIMSLEHFQSIRTTLGKIVCASGGFDPIHPGHTSYLIASKKYGETLVVVVKGDPYLVKKKGKSFQDLYTRCAIVSSIRHVDFVVPYEVENDSTVNTPLRLIQPHVYTKGGYFQRLYEVPEFKTCEQYNISLIIRVGINKEWSSSQMLTDWAKFWCADQNKIEGG